MLCQNCKKNIATINSVNIINGEKFESHLCAMCYAALYGEFNSKANADILTGLFGSPPSRRKVCKVCGTSYEDYERTGLLGCASCYDVFKEELMLSIENIQGKTTHVGKVGENNDELGLHRTLKTLQEQLEGALREKRFEDAGRLNRRISAITKKLYGGDGDDRR